MIKTQRLFGFILVLALTTTLDGAAGASTEPSAFGKVVQDDMVLWIEFEDDASDGILDSSAYGNHGTCTSCPARTSDAKVGSYAYEFDRGEYFGLGDTTGSELEPQTMTISFWLKVLSAIGTDTILGLCGPDSGTGQQGYRFIYDQEQNAVRFQVGHRPVGTNLNGLRTDVKAREQVALNEWYHITGRWDGENLAIFVNGKVSNENYFKNMDAGTNPVAYSCNAPEFFIGSGLFYGDSPRSARHSNVILDDLRMYDRALTDAEIAELACGADGECTSGTRLCPKQFGVCAGSQQTCDGQDWPGCYDADYTAWDSQYEAKESSCGDGLDNDCDGKTDGQDDDCYIIRVSRDSGVAPLAIFFDAISDYDWAFIEQSDFAWDFGDGSPEFKGYMAAHVYELDDGEPVTAYTATLTIRQDGQVVDSETRTIAVSPFSGRTICVSISGNFADCPSVASADHFTDLGLAWDEVGTNTRILLRRGDEWTSGVSYTKTEVPGPVIVGAYGVGDRPKVTFTDLEEPTFVAYASPDWRFVDLHVEGGGDSDLYGFGGACLTGGGDCKDVLILRTYVNGNTSNITAPGVKDGFFIFDSTFENVSRYLSYNYYGEDIAFVNVTAHESLGGHFYRIGGPERLLVYGNDISDPGTGNTTHDTLTIRGGGYYSRYSLVSNNVFRKPGWLVQLGSQNTDSAGPFRYMVIEGNTFAPYPGQSETNAALILDGYDAVVRNNIFVDVSRAVSIGARATFDDSRRIGIYNNDQYLSPGLRGAGFLRLDELANPQDIEVYNNILSADGGAWSIFTGDNIDVNEIASDNNIWNIPDYLTFFGYDLATWQTTYGKDVSSLSADPQFLSRDPANADFLRLSEGSPAIDAGSYVPVFEDYGGNRRPQDGDGDGSAKWDIGVYEFTPELVLMGTPADQVIHLSWSVNTPLPPTNTWQIDYRSQTGTLYPAITNIVSPTRAYTLPGLTNYVWYTVTLNAMAGTTSILADTVRVMPTDRFVYLPLVLRAHGP